MTHGNHSKESERALILLPVDKFIAKNLERYDRRRRIRVDPRAELTERERRELDALEPSDVPGHLHRF